MGLRAHRSDHVAERHATRPEPIRLIFEEQLLNRFPDGSHLRHARYRLERRSQELLL